MNYDTDRNLQLIYNYLVRKKAIQKRWIALFIFSMLGFYTEAQKLPNKQEVSVWASSNLKVGSGVTKWDDKFEAYNNAVDLFYTLSNDNDNLFLVIKATKPRIIDKIIDVGITFIVNYSGKKNDDAGGSVSITYPIVDVASGQRIIINAGNKIRSGVPIPLRSNRKPVMIDSTDQLPKRNDSLVAAANKLFASSANNIKITGISAITDNAISIYNEEGIKVSAAFDRQGVYTYRLSVPMKYLHISLTDKPKFTYSIKLNSRLLEPKTGMTTRYVYPGGVKTDVDQDLNSTTDFWGEYALAKKP